jgi:hypothetical protein
MGDMSMTVHADHLGLTIIGSGSSPPTVMGVAVGGAGEAAGAVPGMEIVAVGRTVTSGMSHRECATVVRYAPRPTTLRVRTRAASGGRPMSRLCRVRALFQRAPRTGVRAPLASRVLSHDKLWYG